MKSLSEFTISRKQEGLKTLVVYLTAGLDSWVDCVHAAQDNGADIIEIGLPFSDPIMDGPVISQASAQSIKNGSKTLDLLEEIKEANFKKPYVIMTYTNVLYAHGLKKIIPLIVDASVSGLILPDLTFEQSSLFAEELADTDISLIQLVASTTNDKRKIDIINTSQGFLYCVAIKGITGQNIDLTETYTEFIEPIHSQSPMPTYCGVGIRTPQDAKNVAKISDGVIVGTSVVEKMLGNNPVEEVGKLVKQFREALDS
ncbi:MAG: tryptophan synthase subunit alpha [Acidimicrobiia bacterium]